MPERACEFAQCEFLLLHWNLIFGPLPRSLRVMSQLLVLNVSGNALCGPLDAQSFVTLTRLKHLDLSFNRYECMSVRVYECM